ncbi:hypothetical protein LEWO105114_03980 [Legionella worsleiensis]|nr:Uncharacterised protein [Legionella worsleiensis]
MGFIHGEINTKLKATKKALFVATNNINFTL